MEPFLTHSGRTAVLDQPNMDTDRIIPARFLSRVDRTGYGEQLFADVRGPDFPLDRPEAKGASVLVVGENFGCGSSREHAVWAIQQAGFRAVIAQKTERVTGFSDIFRQNATINGLLLVELPPGEHRKLADAGSGAEVSIDLPAQTVLLNGEVMRFDINAATKKALMEGLDLIGSTLQHEEKIAAYERQRGPWIPPRRK
ncbi:MAG: 3-isopropylmalate dehydratase small subunit [Armatimonadetes bacterium]|nr:3-isopropylmalate dehydratase small subunit [Armatimonadota bacterium]